MHDPSHASFWQRLDELAASTRVILDRPRGSAHPRYADLIYPHDYGYLEGTLSADGGGIDVWAGSLPNRAVCGVVVTLDTLKRDAEIKILLGCTPGEAQEIARFHNQFSQAGLLVLRQD